jgi:hypothetical protein
MKNLMNYKEQNKSITHGLNHVEKKSGIEYRLRKYFIHTAIKENN